ncbi:MAG: Nif3-like dinuclear metal center hexameric protein [Flavobacteriales bacterium]|nr:Nif3-like dinuclear metal center hexameric protein [Flavobacteriales bacterium]
MLLKELINYLQDWAPLSLQESYDNSGLIVGDPNKEVSKALVCLDSTEDVLDDAIAMGAEVVIAHHPIVFSGLKRFNGSTYVERVVMKAIKNDIALYAIHTNLDNVKTGVNEMIATKLGLENYQILAPKGGLLKKVRVYVPTKDLDSVSQAMWDAGAGEIGNYDQCSFRSEGKGTFRAGDGTNPHVGEQGEIHEETESCLEVVVETWKLNSVLKAMRKSHPYEEVAYDVHDLQLKHNQVGAGMVGDLKESLSIEEFYAKVKSSLDVSVIKSTKPHVSGIRKVAVCGGSGSFLLNAAKRSGADVLVTSDFKYHQFFDAEDEIIIADIGHYESEHHVMQWIQDKLKQKFPNFAVQLTQVNTNPVHYY